AEVLGRIKGRFLMSLNDRPEVRDTFAVFQLTEVRTTYTINAQRNDQPGSRAELLISNWAIQVENQLHVRREHLKSRPLRYFSNFSLLPQHATGSSNLRAHLHVRIAPLDKSCGSKGPLRPVQTHVL
ncbi:MAG: hypothetical protein ACK5LJ_10535, partial [Paracoccus sp. (in: a-proteobacteria)]